MIILSIKKIDSKIFKNNKEIAKAPSGAFVLNKHWGTKVGCKND